MATIKELVNGYFLRIKNSNNEQEEIKKVINEIDDLIYTSSNEPINSDTKKKILEELEKELQGIIKKGFDNKEYLKLVSLAIEHLKNNKSE